MTLTIREVRNEFPILSREVRGKPLVYLDSAATYLKPKSVVEALAQHYLLGASNIHRGVHALSEKATLEYETTRETVRKFINAKSLSEIIFTSGTTDSINLVARALSDGFLKSGDEILVTHMEHHSNFVPWQMAAERVGAKFVVAPINDSGELLLEEFEKRLTPRTRVCAFVHISNSLGTINPVAQMIAMAKKVGALTLIDGAQAVAHFPVNVQELDCDFYAFSAHKMGAPSGVGVLYGKKQALEALPPVKGGGDMIKSVTLEKTTYADLPARLEAGTPAIGATIALAAAIEFINHIGWAFISKQETMLLQYGTELLENIPGIRIIGTAKNKAGVLSFVTDKVHPHDMGTILDTEGVAVRGGHHCTQPVMKRMQIPATTRASLAFYNTREDLDSLAKGIRKAQELFA